MRRIEPLNHIDNDKENQQFNTFDVLSVFICFALVLSIGGLVFKSHLRQKKTVAAKTYVENLAQELIMKPVISSQDSSMRMPASESETALDPWGFAYKYNIIKNSYGQPIYVVVMSGGPNNSFETEIQESMAFTKSQIENVQFKGDDIGYIKSFR